MSRRMIWLHGARGGHGTTTLATTLALYAAGHQPTALVSSDPASTAALIGIPLPVADDQVHVAPNLMLTTELDSAGESAPEIVVIDAGLGLSEADARRATSTTSSSGDRATSPWPASWRPLAADPTGSSLSPSRGAASPPAT